MEQGFQVLLQVFGGLALFLYGTDSLCRAVQQGAGRRLRSLLARCTANPAAGLLLGKLKFEGSKGALLKLASFL